VLHGVFLLVRLFGIKWDWFEAKIYSQVFRGQTGLYNSWDHSRIIRRICKTIKSIFLRLEIVVLFKTSFCLKEWQWRDSKTQSIGIERSVESGEPPETDQTNLPERRRRREPIVAYLQNRTCELSNGRLQSAHCSY
jgi:hypothetical protein